MGCWSIKVRLHRAVACLCSHVGLAFMLAALFCIWWAEPSRANQSWLGAPRLGLMLKSISSCKCGVILHHFVLHQVSVQSTPFCCITWAQCRVALWPVSVFLTSQHLEIFLFRPTSYVRDFFSSNQHFQFDNILPWKIRAMLLKPMEEFEKFPGNLFKIDKFVWRFLNHFKHILKKIWIHFLNIPFFTECLSGDSILRVQLPYTR